MKQITCIFCISMLILLSACSTQTTQIIDLEPQQAKEMLDNKEQTGLFVLNVHTPYEGKLEKTDEIIEDWQNITKHQNQLPKDKNTKILVYCRSGRMSTSAAKQLQDLGYTNIYHLKGGMNAWKTAELPIQEKA